MAEASNNITTAASIAAQVEDGHSELEFSAPVLTSDKAFI